MDDVKNHPYFAKHHPDVPKLHKESALTVPSLRDLCVRAVAEQAIVTSLDPDVPEPGDGGTSDMTRMNEHDRERVMHFLDRMEKLQEPRVLRRFYKSTMEAKMSRVRPMTRDFLGLTSERQSQYEKVRDFMRETTLTEICSLPSVIPTHFALRFAHRRPWTMF
jgi:hypothetical protein